MRGQKVTNKKKYGRYAIHMYVYVDDINATRESRYNRITQQSIHLNERNTLSEHISIPWVNMLPFLLFYNSLNLTHNYW